MAAFCHFFSVYLLLLSCLPCTDTIAGHEYKSDPFLEMVGEAQGSHTHEHQHRHDDGGTEECSPLCACQCCHIAACLALLTDLASASLILLGFDNPAHVPALHNAIAGSSIWQPPRA